MVGWVHRKLGARTFKLGTSSPLGRGPTQSPAKVPEGDPLPIAVGLLPRAPSAHAPQTLKDQLAAAGRGVDYIVVSHTEPDHSFLVPAVRTGRGLSPCMWALVGRLRGEGLPGAIDHIVHTEPDHATWCPR